MTVPLHMPVQGTPYAHQREAFGFICGLFGLTGEKNSGGAALLAEMGTGKTYIAIAVIGTLCLMGKIRRALIVCPLSIMSVWETELKKFAVFPYRATALRGTMKAKRARIAQPPRSALEIVIANYETVWRLEDALADFGADLILADEGHRLKDGTSHQSRAMHRLGDAAAYRLLLTGTAIANNPLDVYSEYRFVAPRIFGASFRAFRDRYFTMGGYGGYVPIFRKEMTEDFLGRLHAIAYRVSKAECLDLPAVTEEIRPVELETKAMRLYWRLEEESFAELRESEVTVMNMLTLILRLSQITGGHLKDDDNNIHQVSTAKLDALADIVDTMRAEGKKLVVMARFIPELDEIEALLRNKRIAYACVRGSVKDRAEEVRRFQEDPDCAVFLGQIQAAGMGLTLTAASTMVFYSLDYSMVNFDQAKARIHRVSQRECCHYIYLCCPDTIDCKVLRALRRKKDVARAMIDDWREGMNPFR